MKGKNKAPAIAAIDEYTARVVSFHGNRAEVVIDDATAFVHVRRQAGTLVAGDRVQLREENGERIVTERLPRTNELSRPDRFGKTRTLAANLDQLLIVVAAAPTPDPQLIDRYLVLSELQRIAPLLIINKIDLDEESPELLAHEFAPLTDAVIRTSCTTGEGIDLLQARLAGRVSAFTGQSGVGKSSLVNRLCPAARTATADLTHAEALGRHTTSTSRLYPVAAGGWIIDSPGIRELSLQPVDPPELVHGFRDLGAVSGNCRFRDCLHIGEPGCAVREAVAEGRITERRYGCYRALLSEMHPNRVPSESR